MDEEVKPFDVVSAIMEFEQGDMDHDRAIEFFQHLIDTGLAWQLQGYYGRTAHDLIKSGYCHAAQG
jgi:hypothetical protein